MTQLLIRPSRARGCMSAPPSKSQTLRAILLASLAKGVSNIEAYLLSPDTQAMINACQQLGAQIDRKKDRLTILGFNAKPQTPNDVIDAGNSGQVLRFISAVAALNQGYSVITGDASLRFRRPMQPLIDGLNALGATCFATKGDGHAPLIVRGNLQAGYASVDGQDSQPISGLLIACAFAPGPCEIDVIHPGEIPWVNLTLSWFDRLGIAYQNQHFHHYTLQGQSQIQGFDYQVPGDFSSMAYPLAAGIISQTELVIGNLDMKDHQGDKALISLLRNQGVPIEMVDNRSAISLRPGGIFLGGEIAVNKMIDALPLLAVLACYAKTTTQLTEARIARFKESDRLLAITQELRKMGAQVEEYADCLVIRPSPLVGAVVDSHKDHRIAMALSIAALGAQGMTVIEHADCIQKSYPSFVKDLEQLHVDVKVIS